MKASGEAATGVLLTCPICMSIYFFRLKSWRRWLRLARLTTDSVPALVWLHKLQRRIASVQLRINFSGSHDSYGSIRLVDMKLNATSDREEFLANTKAALALIEHNDPAAWHMVAREIEYIINMYLSSAGAYIRRQRACEVDHERCFRSENPAAETREWYIASLAATIVHEATHGRVYSLGVSYNKATRERVERLCVLRERRFLARLHSDRYVLTAITLPFDARRWHPYWQRGAKFRIAREAWRRLCQDLRTRKHVNP